jgi:D-3-phosphoglycerate dehydrogenase
MRAREHASELNRVGVGPVLPQSLVDLLDEQGAGIEAVRFRGTSEPEIMSIADGLAAIVVGTREAITARVIEALTECRLIVRYGIGVDNVDVDTATRCGVMVTTVPDANIDEVSDHTLALLLNLARHIPALSRAVASGAWSSLGSSAIVGIRDGIHRLRGRVLGLVGFGQIGRATWQKARALGFVGIVHDPLVPEGLIRASGAEPVGWAELLRRSDFVTLHLPLTADTRNVINARAFHQMKSGCFLINTARGALVDEEALVAAVSSGRIRGAALDVTLREPIPKDSPLLCTDGILLTGHTAFYSDEAIAETDRRIAAMVSAVVRGGVPEGLINPSAVARSYER